MTLHQEKHSQTLPRKINATFFLSESDRADIVRTSPYYFSMNTHGSRMKNELDGESNSIIKMNNEIMYGTVSMR